MKFLVTAVVVVALSGCVATDPGLQKLKEACDGGDLGACAFIAEQQQRRREAVGAALQGVGRNMAQASGGSGMKVCPNGMIVQQLYIC